MKNFFLGLLLCIILIGNANSACNEAPGDGVDYEGCAFSDEQNLTGTYLPNSNLSFTGFIKVIFDKSIMMNSKLSHGNFPESSFVRANLYEANLEGGIFEKTNFFVVYQRESGEDGIMNEEIYISTPALDEKLGKFYADKEMEMIQNSQ